MDEQDLLTLKIECTLFFQKNPYTLETEQGVAMRTGRRVEHIRDVLDDLVHRAILEKIGDGERAIYRYVQPVFVDGTGLACPSQ